MKKVFEVVEILKRGLCFIIARELVNDWLDAELKQDLSSDGEGDAEDTVSRIPSVPEASGHLKYDKFDGKNLPDCSKS